MSERNFRNEHIISRHQVCCNRRYNNPVLLEEHCVACLNYCRLCKVCFVQDEDLYEHCSCAHADSWRSECLKLLKTPDGLPDHFRQSNVQHYCVLCDRHFGSANNLKAHLNSSTHLHKNVICPASGCGRRFISRSALLLHLDVGLQCTSGSNYDKVNFLVKKMHPNTRIIMNSKARNGIYFCRECGGRFNRLSAFGAHIDSATWDIVGDSEVEYLLNEIVLDIVGP